MALCSGVFQAVEHMWPSRCYKAWPPPAVLSLVQNAVVNIQTHIAQAGNDLIPGGIYTFDSRTGRADCEGYTTDSHNHRQTWGVVGAALLAVADYMLSNNNMGKAEFTIYDGGTEVGQETVDVSVNSDA